MLIIKNDLNISQSKKDSMKKSNSIYKMDQHNNNIIDRLNLSCLTEVLTEVLDKEISDNDFTKFSKKELIRLCKEKKVKGFSSKTKEQIIQMLESNHLTNSFSEIFKINTKGKIQEEMQEETQKNGEKIVRLNYIGSKFQLLDWITSIILEKTKWSTFENKVVADLFAGTGIVSYHFRKQGSIVLSNDVESYSSIITHAFNRSIYNKQCKDSIEQLNKDFDENKYQSFYGLITKHYSPFNKDQPRNFFTIDNSQRIDYVRVRIESMKDSISYDTYIFLLASLIISADSVSNVPAVYGCFLKQFKSKAIKPFILKPIIYVFKFFRCLLYWETFRPGDGIHEEKE